MFFFSGFWHMLANLITFVSERRIKRWTTLCWQRLLFILGIWRYFKWPWAISAVSFCEVPAFPLFWTRFSNLQWIIWWLYLSRSGIKKAFISDGYRKKKVRKKIKEGKRKREGCDGREWDVQPQYICQKRNRKVLRSKTKYNTGFCQVSFLSPILFFNTCLLSSFWLVANLFGTKCLSAFSPYYYWYF